MQTWLSESRNKPGRMVPAVFEEADTLEVTETWPQNLSLYVQTNHGFKPEPLGSTWREVVWENLL